MIPKPSELIDNEFQFPSPPLVTGDAVVEFEQEELRQCAIFSSLFVASKYATSPRPSGPTTNEVLCPTSPVASTTSIVLYEQVMFKQCAIFKSAVEAS